MGGHDAAVTRCSHAQWNQTWTCVVCPDGGTAGNMMQSLESAGSILCRAAWRSVSFNLQFIRFTFLGNTELSQSSCCRAAPSPTLPGMTPPFLLQRGFPSMLPPSSLRCVLNDRVSPVLPSGSNRQTETLRSETVKMTTWIIRLSCFCPSFFCGRNCDDCYL